MTTLSDTAQLAAPLVDVRDVLETFRRHRVLTEDWAVVLSNAANTLDQASTAVIAPRTVTLLAAQLRTLLTNGLQENMETVNRVANETQRILSQTRIRGLPRPEDENWKFS